MGRIKDITGQRFGKLTVVRPDYQGKRGQWYWLCKCDCGNEKVIRGADIVNGKIKTCHACIKMKDIAGQRFGRLIAISPAYEDDYKRWKWNCKCDCGNDCVIGKGELLRKNNPTQSCGCISLEISTTHGCSQKDVSNVYYGILHRCHNPRSKDYPRYGGRGIEVCSEWREDIRSFVNWSEKSGYEKGLTIDRINNDGNYSPENCHWIPFAAQNKNKSTNKLITYKGDTKILKEWADYLGIRADTLRYRLKHGWGVERAFTEAVHKGPRKNLL